MRDFPWHCSEGHEVDPEHDECPTCERAGVPANYVAFMEEARRLLLGAVMDHRLEVDLDWLCHKHGIPRDDVAISVEKRSVSVRLPIPLTTIEVNFVVDLPREVGQDG